MFPMFQRKLRLLLAGALLLALPTVAAADFRKVQGPTAEGQYIVVFKNEHAARNAVSQLAAKHAGKVARVWESALNGALFTNLNEAQARALAKNPNVAWVEENARISLAATQNSPAWGLDRIDQQVRPLSSTYNYAFDGSGVHAYVIDTGIRDSHNDFGGRASRDWDGMSDNQNGNDCHGHGTHVAGILGGSTYGVAKNVRLHSVRVFDCQGNTTTAIVINGINWVIDNAQRPAVINMSLRGGASDALDTATNNAVNAGIFAVAGAGNDNQDACNFSPARAAQAFTVAATDSLDIRASFSNFGACVEIFAPGVGILSAGIADDSSTATMNGTSMATPHVVGVAALMLDEDANLTPANLRDRLLARSTPNVVSSAGANSPNRFLYSLTLVAGGLPQMPASLTILPLLCYGYNDAFWTTADGATTYELYQSTSSSFTTQTLVYSGPDDYAMANVAGTRYLRVRACGPTGCSAYRHGNRAATRTNGCL